MRKAIVLAAVLALFSNSSRALDISLLTEGDPYVVASRCYGAVLAVPDIDWFGAQEALMNIIAKDPHLDADIKTGKAFYEADHSPRARMLDFVGRFIYFTARDMQAGLYRPNEVRSACLDFVARNG